MKRIFLLLIALSTTPLTYAQRDYQDARYRQQDVLAPIHEELNRLRVNRDVVEFAAVELERAEDYLEVLATLPPHQIGELEIEKAMRMLARAERVAARRSGSEPGFRQDPGPGQGPGQGPGRGRGVVVVVNDPAAQNEARQARSEAEQARYEADQNRSEAEQARLEADQNRSEAEQARLDAEQERAENARLRAELGQAQTRVTERGVVLTLGDVLFGVDRTDLMAGGMRTLDKLVAAMRRNPENTVLIEGHTDSTGARAYNMDLSKRRANAVRSYLMMKGVASQRIKSRGLGPDAPVASNASAAGRQQNRRVEILVQNDGFDQ